MVTGMKQGQIGMNRDAERLKLAQTARAHVRDAKHRVERWNFIEIEFIAEHAALADALESAIAEKRARDKRIDELEARASDWLNRANENYDKLKVEKQAAEKERDDLKEGMRIGNIDMQALLEQNRVLMEALQNIVDTDDEDNRDLLGGIAREALRSTAPALAEDRHQLKGG